MMKYSFVHRDDSYSRQIKDNLIKRIDGMVDDTNPDIVFTIGGDGTVLDAVSKYMDNIEHILFVTIHTGNLGFYTEFLPSDIDLMCHLIKNGDTEYQSYPLLEISINGHKRFGLNEMTLSNTRHLLETSIYINDEFLMKTRSNGICVSTPTGSTAYNKSLGGAVMDYQVEAYQLTLIAPFETIKFRMLGPIVLSKGNKLTIKPLTDNYDISCDRSYIEETSINQIHITLSDKKVKFMKNAIHTFTSKLKDKFIGQ